MYGWSKEERIKFAERLKREIDAKGAPYEGPKADQAHAGAQQSAESVEAERRAAIERAMRRNVSSGGAGMPYLVIDIVQAMACHGGKDEAPSPFIAMEQVKDALWAQCRYLGGDAVLYCRFEIKDGVTYSQNRGARTFNAIAGLIDFASATGRSAPTGIRMATTSAHQAVTVIGYGTVAKLMPSDQPITPDDYASWRPGDVLPELESAG